MPRYRTGKRPDLEGLLKDAADTGGLFTTRQAEEHGVSRQLLSFHTKAGRLMRVARGLYRSPLVPESPHEEALERIVAVGPGAVAAGPTALTVSGVGHLVPDAVFVRVPRGYPLRLPRELAEGTEIISDDFPVDTTSRDGVPTESVASAFASTASHTEFDLDQLMRAVDEAAARGLIDKQAVRREIREVRRRRQTSPPTGTARSKGRER